MKKATTQEELTELREEFPNETIALHVPGEPHQLIFQPGRDMPMRVPVGHKARYSDNKVRPY